MTLNKTVEDINSDTRLITASPAIISLRRLNASIPGYVQIGPVYQAMILDGDKDIQFFSDDGCSGFTRGLVYEENKELVVSLLQSGIYNLAIALNCNDEDHIDITQSEFDPPSDGVISMGVGGRRDLEEYEIKIQIQSASSKKIREYKFFRAIPIFQNPIKFSSREVNLIECRFKILYDKSRPENSKYFSVTDYLASDWGNVSAPNY